MKIIITERKCKDCDTIISYIPRQIRCLDCHQKYLDNAMFSTKKDDDFTKGKQYEYMKQAINNIQKRNVEALIDKIFKTK